MNELELVDGLQAKDEQPVEPKRNESLTAQNQQANNTSGKVGTHSELDQERAAGIRLRPQNMSMHALKSSPMSRAAKNQDTMNMSVNKSVLDNSVCFADQASYGDFYKQMKSKFFGLGGRNKNINILDGLKDDASQRPKSKADRPLARQSDTGIKDHQTFEFKEVKVSSIGLLKPIQISKTKTQSGFKSVGLMPEMQESPSQPKAAQNEQESGFNMHSIKSQSTVRRQLKQPVRIVSEVRPKDVSDDFEADKTYLAIRQAPRKDARNDIHEVSHSSSDESEEGENQEVEVKRDTRADGVAGSNRLLSLNQTASFRLADISQHKLERQAGDGRTNITFARSTLNRSDCKHNSLKSPSLMQQSLVHGNDSVGLPVHDRQSVQVLSTVHGGLSPANKEASCFSNMLF